MIIPNSVTSIGNSAFSDCSGLMSIIIPNSVTSIGIYAFSNCSDLTSITIPDSITSIGRSTFKGCRSLTEINVSANNKYYCSQDGILFNKDKTVLICYPADMSGTSYIIPDRVTSIEHSAFFGCDGLTSITIHDSVTSIGDSVFENCSSLTNVFIPDSVTSIGDSAFFSCGSLTSIRYTGTMEQWTTITKGVGWNSYTGNYTIVCSDGNISKN